MKRYAWILLVLTTAVSLAASRDNQSPTDSAYLGKIKPRSAREIEGSIWSIGGETLDRDYAVYGNYKKFLGPLGAKAIRVQAGWAKCEKQKGVYDFAWLDEVVNDSIAQGVQPWLEVSYGNTLYPGGGGTGLGGGLPTSTEALEAWDKWVQAAVKRYKDRVVEWEIWNEPDLGNKMAPEAYTSFFIRTAEVIKQEQPGAAIYALGLAGNIKFAEAFLVALKEQGKLGLVNALTVHGYPRNPDDTYLVDAARALVETYAPGVAVRQGETGAPSTGNTFGALSGLEWNELNQAKWNLRRMLAHHAKGIPFNLFTLMELHYPDRVNAKGLLKSNPDKTVERPKLAYYAAQNVFSVFDASMDPVPRFEAKSSLTNKLAAHAFEHLKTKAAVVTLWLKDGMPGQSLTTTPARVELRGVKIKEPVYADLLTGVVRRIPAGTWSQQEEGMIFEELPLYDSPILVGERDLVLRK